MVTRDRFVDLMAVPGFVGVDGDTWAGDAWPS
jgi:hypothetical protein